MGSSCHGPSRRQHLRNADHCWVQPPDAENRMSGGVEGSRGAIPVGPSNPSLFDRSCRAMRALGATPSFPNGRVGAPSPTQISGAPPARRPPSRRAALSPGRTPIFSSWMSCFTGPRWRAGKVGRHGGHPSSRFFDGRCRASMNWRADLRVVPNLRRAAPSPGRTPIFSSWTCCLTKAAAPQKSDADGLRLVAYASESEASLPSLFDRRCRAGCACDLLC